MWLGTLLLYCGMAFKSLGFLFWFLDSKYFSSPPNCFAAQPELSCRWVDSNFVAGFKNSFAMGTKIVLGGLRFLSSMRLEISGLLQTETVLQRVSHNF